MKTLVGAAEPEEPKGPQYVFLARSSANQTYTMVSGATGLANLSLSGEWLIRYYSPFGNGND